VTMRVSRQTLSQTAIIAIIASSPNKVESSISFISSVQKNSFHRTCSNSKSISHPKKLRATLEESSSATKSSSELLDNTILPRISSAAAESQQWGLDFDLVEESPFHSLFSGIRSSAALGLKGRPFYVKQNDIVSAMEKGTIVEGDSNGSSPFAGYFTFDDLAQALQDDFLDANRGTTDNRKGWKVSAVSNPRGSSFEDARMTLDDVNAALEKGTVIFNTAGSHIPKLARATLACTDAASLPCALNLYVTAANKRTSAPPHTDGQDVIVVQTAGKKHWKVYSPPDPSLKPSADMYARGKGDDSLPLYSLEDASFGCTKLLDVTLEAGDILFVPAGFPHSTDTINSGESDTASIHLTFNFDTHVWDLDYLSVRRLALRKAGVADSALGQETEEDNRYVGNANLVPAEVRNDLFENLPLGFLDEDKIEMIDEVTNKLEQVSRLVDQKTYELVPSQVWQETVERVRSYGIDMLDIHRDMYLAAIDEGRTREIEEAMTAHLSAESTNAKVMTPEKMQRLSLFRVQKFFEKVDESKEALTRWSFEGSSHPSSAGGAENTALPENWEFTLPLAVGDQVEADLGGAFFEATVTKADNSKYDVKFFDGDVMNGLDRSMVKLLAPPSTSAGSDEDKSDEEQPPPGLTKKELKKWMKKKEKKESKKGF